MISTAELFAGHIGLTTVEPSLSMVLCAFPNWCHVEIKREI